MQSARSTAVTALVSTALLGAGTVLAAAPAHADPTTCQGRAVTIAGDAGTDGDDVMVVGPGQRSVSTGAGNDLVCIRLGDDVRRYFALDTGPGDDVVHNESTDSTRDVSTVLGTGADTYVGSDASVEGVSAGAMSTGTSDTEKDVVDTRGGNDWVSTGSVATGTPNPDVISTGEGDDALYWAGEQAGGQVDLGPGENRIVLRSGWAGSGVDIDAPDGLVTADSRPVLRWTGEVTAYTLEYTYPRTTFTGTGLDEYLTFWPSQAEEAGSAASDPALRLDADMGAGDDRLVLLDAAGGSWTGGPGQDRLQGPRCVEAEVRLGGTYECRAEGRSRTQYTASIDAWERLVVPGWRLRVVGSPGPDRISTYGAYNHVDGRGGDDVLAVPSVAGVGKKVLMAVVRGGAGDDLIRGSYLRNRLLGGPGADSIRGGRSDDVVRGGPGRDRMWGSKGDDRLLGGPGRDLAEGGPGRDRCVAEVRRSCERR